MRILFSIFLTTQIATVGCSAEPDQSETSGTSDPVAAWEAFCDRLKASGVELLREPDALLWSFQLGNFWWESLDYVNRTASINGSQAVSSSDGRIRIVVSLADPGVPNWLDPGGHSEGMILYRYQRARTAPEPAVTVVAFADLAKHLPGDTAVVTPEDRKRGIALRRAHATRRWAP